MVMFRYSLTAEDYAELELLRRGGIFRRSLRITVGVLLGCIGLFYLWPVFFVFPWNHWFGNVALASMGLLLLWLGLETPGLTWLSRFWIDPYAEREVVVRQGIITCSFNGRPQSFRWDPLSDLKEDGRFWFVQTKEHVRIAIPKRAVSVDQESQLRQMTVEEPALVNLIESRFFLRQAEVDEASALIRPRMYSWSHSRAGRVLSHSIIGLNAVMVPWLPQLFGKSWREEFAIEPGVAVGVIAYGLFLAWVALGSPGAKALNRLDAERRIAISELGAEVECGRSRYRYAWRQFHTFRESDRLFVLQTNLRSWTIPKRALAPVDEPRLRSLLESHLVK
jgi:hypothetical protein